MLQKEGIRSTNRVPDVEARGRVGLRSEAAMSEWTREEWAKRVERWKDSGLSAGVRCRARRSARGRSRGGSGGSAHRQRRREARPRGRRGRAPRQCEGDGDLAVDVRRDGARGGERSALEVVLPSSVRDPRRAWLRRVDARSSCSTSWSDVRDPDVVRIFVCTERQDMRRSFDALALAVRERLALDPESGALFVFASKRGNRLKVLWFDHNGYCLLYKRLHARALRAARRRRRRTVRSRRSMRARSRRSFAASQSDLVDRDSR